MKWHDTKDNIKPKPIHGETIPCIVQRYNCFELCYWDESNDCWNDRDDDDYAYDFEKVDYWAYIEDEKYENN
jgi:hypothetical protein